MFPVSEHSAEKVQNDINTILSALAQFLAKVNLDYNPQPVLPPIAMAAVLESEPFIDVEVISEHPALSGHHPDLLEGRDNLAIAGTPTLPLLPSQAEVRLQIGDTHIIALLPDVRSQLEQLLPEKVATLAGAIGGSAETPPEVIDGEIIDVTIDGTCCFHQEPGQATVNGFLPANNPQQIEPVDTAETERIQDITLVTEIGEKGSEAPTVELRPAHEVEALTGQDMGDISALHQQVLQDAAPVRVLRDQYGHIKGGAAVRAPVEVTEDAVEAEVEYQAEHQPLTPEAKAVIQELHDYFDRTGEQALAGDNSYRIERLDGNALRFTPYDDPGEAITIRDNQIASEITTTRYAHLMLRFAAAYESLRVVEQESDQELEVSK